MALYDNEPTMMGQGRPSATLVIRQGPQAGMSFPLAGAQTVVGREEGLDVTLQDPEASRRHARITWQAGQYVIEDLGSTNGTFINGVQTTAPQILNPGDTIGIGQTALVFQLEGVQMSAPPYQAPAEYVPSATAPPPAAPANVGSDNKTTQYALYGCGCLILLFVCFLVVVAAVFLLNPDLVDDLISLNLNQYRSFLA